MHVPVCLLEAVRQTVHLPAFPDSGYRRHLPYLLRRYSSHFRCGSSLRGDLSAVQRSQARRFWLSVIELRDLVQGLYL